VALSAQKALSEQSNAGAKCGVKHEGAETVTRAKLATRPVRDPTEAQAKPAGSAGHAIRTR